MDLRGALQVAFDLIGQIAFGPSDEGDERPSIGHRH